MDDCPLSLDQLEKVIHNLDKRGICPTKEAPLWKFYVELKRVRNDKMYEKIARDHAKNITEAMAGIRVLEGKNPFG